MPNTPHGERLGEEQEVPFAALWRETLQTSRAWAHKNFFRWFWTHTDADAGAEFHQDWYN